MSSPDGCPMPEVQHWTARYPASSLPTTPSIRYGPENLPNCAELVTAKRETGGVVTPVGHLAKRFVRAVCSPVFCQLQLILWPRSGWGHVHGEEVVVKHYTELGDIGRTTCPGWRHTSSKAFVEEPISSVSTTVFTHQVSFDVIVWQFYLFLFQLTRSRH